MSNLCEGVAVKMGVASMWEYFTGVQLTFCTLQLMTATLRDVTVQSC